MRWPWHKPAPQAQPNIEQACADLQRVVAQREDVDRLRYRLRTHREMNGFADLVFRPARGGRRT